MPVKREGEELESQSKRQEVDGSESALKVLLDLKQATILSKELENVQKLSSAQMEVSGGVARSVDRFLTINGGTDAIAAAIFECATIFARAAESQVYPGTFTLKAVVRNEVGLELQKASNGILDKIASESGATAFLVHSFLPLSTERLVCIRGQPDSFKKSTPILLQAVLDRADPELNSVGYQPVDVSGRYALPKTFYVVTEGSMQMTQGNPYGVPAQSFEALEAQEAQQNQAQNQASAQKQPQAAAQPGGGPITQQIFIPNDMVGAIIGKAGSKINEIRTMSGSHIKINEPTGDTGTERLVSITGTAECNQMALYMLYSRLEQEKHR